MHAKCSMKSLWRLSLPFYRFCWLVTLTHILSNLVKSRVCVIALICFPLWSGFILQHIWNRNKTDFAHHRPKRIIQESKEENVCIHVNFLVIYQCGTIHKEEDYTISDFDYIYTHLQVTCINFESMHVPEAVESSSNYSRSLDK